MSDANPVGEFTVVPDESGEKATPLLDPGPPPPPVPPPPVMEPDAEVKWDPADGVCVRNLGDESDWADCDPDCSEEKGEGAGFGLPPEMPLVELRTAENDEDVETPGPESKPREDAAGVVEERLVARGVNPRRMPDCDADRPQAPISVLVEEDLSVPEAIDDWAEG